MADIIGLLKRDPTSIIDATSNPQDVLNLVKTLFDPITKGHSVLDEIYVEGLDATQVWPQVKIILESVTDNLLFDTIPALKEKYAAIHAAGSDDFGVSEDDESENESGETLGEIAQESASDENDDDADSDQASNDGLVDDITGSSDDEIFHSAEDGESEEENDSSKTDATGLNDGFFSIDDFNKQILDQENEINDDEDIDFFGDVPDSDDEEVFYHDDFFDKKQKAKFSHKKSKSQSNKSGSEREGEEDDFNDDDFDSGMKSAMNDLYDEDVDLEEEEEDEEQKQRESEKNLSSFQRQQLKIQREIQQLEKEAIAEKKWTMKGEVKVKDRPNDALLTEDLDFERTAKPVPVITKEVTESLEDLIRRRIKEDNFDDLPRRVITDVTNFRPSSTFELSENKSTKSLAELYEDDYKGGETKDKVSEELQQSYDEIKELYQDISYKLDALSSAHFIPKPVQKSIDIKVNAPTITMEDAQPLAASSANTLAPQEVYKATRAGNDAEISLKSGAVVARDELSREDKQRLRRANKRKRSKNFKAKEDAPQKKSKKQDAIDTLAKANNVTIIGNKGEKTDVRGALKKDKVKQGTSALKL